MSSCGAPDALRDALGKRVSVRKTTRHGGRRHCCTRPKGPKGQGPKGLRPGAVRARSGSVYTPAGPGRRSVKSILKCRQPHGGLFDLGRSPRRGAARRGGGLGQGSCSRLPALTCPPGGQQGQRGPTIYIPGIITGNNFRSKAFFFHSGERGAGREAMRASTGLVPAQLQRALDACRSRLRGGGGSRRRAALCPACSRSNTINISITP